MSLLITIIALLYLSICGYGLVKYLLKDKVPFSLFGMIPLSFGAGLGILAILSNLLMLIGLRLSFITIYVPLFFIFVLGLSNLKIIKGIDLQSLGKMLKGMSWKEWLLLTVALSGLISMFLLSCDFPMHFWDSRAIWGAKAKMLFYSGTIFSSDFMDMNRINPHFKYPLLYPISQTYIYFMLGRVDDWAVMLLVGLFFPLMVSFMYDIARIYTNERKYALATAVLLSVLPAFFMHDGPAYSGYADMPLAMLFSLSFGVTLLWKKYRDSGYLLLAAFLSGILFLTKNESMNLIVLNIFLMMLPEKAQDINKENIFRTAKSLILFLAAIALIILPWLILRQKLPFMIDPNEISQLNPAEIIKNITRLKYVIIYMIKAFFGPQGSITGQGYLWCCLWYISMLSVFISLYYRFTRSINLSLVVFLYLGVISVIYTITNIDLGTSLFRLSMAINPILALQIVTTMKELESKSS